MITKVGGNKPWFLDIQPGGRGHKRYQRKFKTKSEALRFEIDIKQKVLTSVNYQPLKVDKRTINEFVEIWFLTTGQFLSSGFDTYNRLLKACLAMGSPIAISFNASFFLDYRALRIQSGISPSTLNRELQTFKSVFSELIRLNQYYGINPFISIRKIKTHQPKTTFLTSDQILLLFECLKKSDSDAYLISLLCLSTGARWGEAQSLQLSDLSEYRVHYHDTKSKRSRSVPLSCDLYQQLLNRLSVSSFHDSYSTFSRRLNDSKILLPAGQRTHILRHTFASHFMMNGGNILTLQKVLGHSSLDMTMKYAHLSPDFMSEVLQKNPALMLF